METARSFYSGTTASVGQSSRQLSISSHQTPFVDGQTKDRIVNWIERDDATIGKSSSSITDLSILTPPSHALTGNFSDLVAEDFDTDTEGDHSVVITTQFHDIALEKYLDRHFQSAESLLQKVIPRLERCTSNSHDEAKSLKLKLADSCLHLGKTAEAESILVSILSSVNKGHTLYSNALYHLIVLCYSKNQLEPATTYCKRAMKISSKLSKEQTDDQPDTSKPSDHRTTYYFSMGLFAHISRLKGEEAEAEVYEGLIPSSIKLPRWQVLPLGGTAIIDEPSCIFEGVLEFGTQYGYMDTKQTEPMFCWISDTPIEDQYLMDWHNNGLPSLRKAALNNSYRRGCFLVCSYTIPIRKAFANVPQPDDVIDLVSLKLL